MPLSSASLRHRERLQGIWDKLAEFPEPQLGNEGLQFLLKSISELIDADHGYWLSGMRIKHLAAESDPMFGWRPGPVFYYQEPPGSTSIAKSSLKGVEAGRTAPGESTVNHIRNAGRFRATLMRDHVSPDFYRSDHYRRFYASRNITDSLFVVAPVNSDTEVYFCFNRVGEQPPFTQDELSMAADTLRSLNWFHKKVLLGHGLLIACKALTPTEKRVMRLLLTNLSEKQIAANLQQKPDTTHKHISNIYRKFNINSRTALIAIWLGTSAQTEEKREAEAEI